MSLQTASYYKAFFSHTVYSFVQCVADLGGCQLVLLRARIGRSLCQGPWGRGAHSRLGVLHLRIHGWRAEDTIVLGTALLLSIL
jgi:hypothetical protein